VQLKSLLCILFCLFSGLLIYAQSLNCNLKSPVVAIGFGSGYVHDLNTEYLSNYERLGTSCPPDGYYSYAPFTSNCFHDDWHTLPEDHTAGDDGGNMLLVNGAPSPGIFLKTIITGLKGNTTYEFGVWLMNLCKPSDKCPYPLLPNLYIRLETEDGKIIEKISTGELQRVPAPHWTQHRAMFTTPSSVTAITLTMMDNSPGGCGNDFAVDDITFRECVKIPPVVTTTAKAVPSTVPKPVVQRKQTAAIKAIPPKKTQAPVAKEAKGSLVVKPQTEALSNSITVVKDKATIFPPPPLVLTTRENSLVKRIETDGGDIKVELYDNGEIDGDTVSIYHNNVLIKSHARLSDKPISFKISVDPSQPHHELIMVADNLGSIPPNTSVMIVTTAATRYEVFISSTEQKNAKVIVDLKK
jgi:hypothetical protein